MTDADALRVVAVLTSYFRQELSDETAVLWARSLRPYEVEDAQEAAVVLGQGLRFMPALAEFVIAVQECRTDRLERQRRGLPEPTRLYYPLALFLHEHPVMGERVKALEATQFVPGLKGVHSAIVPTLADVLASEMEEEPDAG